MNMRRKVKKRELSPETAADIERLESAFSSAREEFGQPGGFLFGDFSAADATFAPVVNRCLSMMSTSRLPPAPTWIG